ncbi:MAG: tetraacyldisaccharide 4'-kinase [Bacteroidetes bacterium]|nr:tetraacyldisaccharide 4'-kinase [Bacteroidota bacterium]
MKYLKILLFPFSIIYWAITALRNKMYDTGFYGSTDFDLPVISVGNLSTGGTGKTPLIEYLINLLIENETVGVLSRGYRRKTNGFFLSPNSPDPKIIGDEPALLKWKYPQIEVAVGEERVMAIPLLVGANPDLSVILLDDAFQHRAARPWISIITTTYQLPFWKDKILPIGNLRESRSGFKRANIIIVTNCPKTLSLEEKTVIKKTINTLENQYVLFSSIEYEIPFLLSNPSIKISLNSALNVLLFAGIGNPEMLKSHVQSKVKSLKWLGFSDHHWYSDRDIFKIEADSKEDDIKRIILTTEKDAIRFYEYMPLIKKEGIEIYVLPMKMQFLANDGILFDKLLKESIAYFKEK